ncbi:MAG: hypothetical protein ACOC12_08820 [Bacteroidota bacterium]
MKRLFISILTSVVISGFIWGKESPEEQKNTDQIRWLPFQWQSQNDYFEQTTNEVMLLNLHIGGIPEVQTFIFNLSTPFSFVYEHGYESMVYRNPDFATRVETVQRVSTMKDRILRDLDITINRNLLGQDHMRIIALDRQTQNDQIKGEMGFGIFHRYKKILLVDNTQARFTNLDELPGEIESKATFVPMRVEAGYIVLPLTIANREIDMIFDGSSRPALLTFHNRTFRQVISSEPAAEKLKHINMNGEYSEVEGYLPKAEVFFQGLPLKNHNIYNVSEKIPGSIRGQISQAFFSDYIMIFDYRNERFGLYKP